MGGAQGFHDAAARLAVGADVGLGRGALLVLGVSGGGPRAIRVDRALVARGAQLGAHEGAEFHERQTDVGGGVSIFWEEGFGAGRFRF